jgi:hypothetical protein
MHMSELTRRLANNEAFIIVRSLFRSKSGVVTVEWVAIAAGVTIGAIAITFIVMHGLVAPAQHIASQLSPPS